MPTKLELKKAACDVAFASAQQTLAAADAAIASKAGELQLGDQQYQQFRNDMLVFRQQFRAAHDADQAEAKKPKPGAPAAIPKPQS